MNRRLLRWGTVALLVVCGAAAAPAANSPAIVWGPEGYFAGMLPPPGLHLLNYGLYYNADNFPSTSPQGGPPDFELTAWAYIFRPVYVSNLKILGGNQFTHLVLPFVDLDIESAAFSDERSGLADIYFSPLLFTWHSEGGIWHCAGGLDFIWPTADFDAARPANLGYDHIVYEPAFAVTGAWPNGWTASIKLMYDIHEEIDDINYEPQDQFHSEFNVGYALGKEWMAGINGFFLVGMDDDTQDSVTVPDTEEKTFALGPSVLFHRGPTAVILKGLWEFEAENRPEGFAGWVRVNYSF